jgi:stage II sporulation protein P
MINFAVINFKNLIKNLIKLIVIILLIIGLMNTCDIFFKKIKNINYTEILKENLGFTNTTQASCENTLSKIINSEIPLLTTNNKISEEDFEDLEIAQETLTEVLENTDVNIEETDEISLVQTTDIPQNVTTTVISENNLTESYNVTYNSVKIKNETNFNLTQNILEPNIEYSDTNNILIFHTHTCESYTQTDANSYTPSGNFRTTDLNYSVAKVGSVLTDYLNYKGYNVTHSLNYHDYPAYTGSYNRSLTTVSSLLEKNPSTELVIDLHRDAVGSMSSYAPCVQIGDETVAQLMFVIGTNGGGLKHDNWQTNLKFAIKIQEKANEMYPRTFSPYYS